MKTRALLTLGGLALSLASCESFKSFNQPISGGASFDPLDPPGMQSGGAAVVVPSSPNYQPGQWVETSMPNATFFLAVPKGNATANKMLPVATPLKVVSTSGTYVKVELDSGEVGFVPEIMIVERSLASQVPVVPPPLDTIPPVGTPNPEVPGLPTGVAPAPPVQVAPAPPTVPAVPTQPVTEPEVLPPAPDVAPPPEVPGITPPQNVD